MMLGRSTKHHGNGTSGSIGDDTVAIDRIFFISYGYPLFPSRYVWKQLQNTEELDNYLERIDAITLLL